MMTVTSDESSFLSLHAPKAFKMTAFFLITAGNEDCQSDRAFQKHVNPRALKIATLYKKRYLSVYGWDILCGILKIPFEIPHKLSYPNIERCTFYSQMKTEELLDFRALKRSQILHNKPNITQ